MTCIFMTYFERRLYHRNRLNCLRHDEGKKCMSSKKSFYKRSSCPTLVRSCSHVAGTVGGGGGEQGWRSGKSTQLPPVSFGFRSRRQSHMWVEFGFDSRSWSDRVVQEAFSQYSDFPIPSTANTSKSGFEMPIRSGMHEYFQASYWELLSVLWAKQPSNTCPYEEVRLIFYKHNLSTVALSPQKKN